MTNLTNPNIHTNPASSPVSAATLAEHADARWADWQRRGVARDDARSQRTWIIASVIGAGLIAWVLITVL